MSMPTVDLVDVVVQSDLLVPHPALTLGRSKAMRIFRVALVVEAAGGGVAVHIADMVRGLRERGNFEIDLVVPLGARFDSMSLGEDVLAQCDAIHRLPMDRSVGGSDVIAFAKLFRCLHRIRPDIVHSHSSKAGALARLCFGPWKQVYTPHAVYTLNPFLSQTQRRFYGLVEGLLGRLRSDRIIAVSVNEAEHLREVLRIPSHRIETIFNGVPAPMLLPADDARDALGLPRNSVIIGFVGRLDFQKGIDRLMRVAQSLEERGLENVIFAIMGPGDFVAAAGVTADSIPNNVRVLGSFSMARRYFSAFDILALPSRYEGFPYVVLEAMAAHVPIVSTRVSGAAELIEEAELGFVVPNVDEMSEFTDATAALASNPKLRDRMSSNCKRAVERFSAAAMVDRTVDLYECLLRERT